MWQNSEVAFRKLFRHKCKCTELTQLVKQLVGIPSTVSQKDTTQPAEEVRKMEK